MADGGGHPVKLLLAIFAQAGDGQIAPKLALQRGPAFTDFVTMEAVDNFVMRWLAFRHHDGLRKPVELERLTQQTLFRRRHVIWVVVVGNDSVLLYPQHAVDGLVAERAEMMHGLAKSIDGIYTLLVGERLQIGFQFGNQSLLHKIPHSLRFDFIRSL